MSHFNYFLNALFFICLITVQASVAEENNQAPPIVETSLESVEFSGNQDENWVKMQADVVLVKTRLDAQRAVVTELLVSKKNNKGRIAKDQVDQLNLNHQKLQELSKEYNQKFNEFEIKYPEKGQSFGRQYNRKTELSLDQMENSLTLEGRIRKMSKKIKAQYGTEAQPATSAQKPKAVEKLTQPVKSKDDITEKIILVK